MTAKSRLLTVLLMLGIMLVGVIAVLSAEAATPPEQTFEATPPLRLDSIEFRAQEAALKLFRQGCAEVRVLVLPDTAGMPQVYATCVEWREIQPASQ